MTDDGLRLQITFRLADERQFKEDATEYFKQHKKLKTVRFGYTTDYAESLEYGTGPLKNFQPTVKGGNYSYETIYKEVYDWAGKKDGKDGFLPIKKEYIRRAFAEKLTDHFFEVGMKPHPYWRPAIQWLADNEQALFDKGYSLMDIADEALRVANKCIMDQNLPFTGKLQQSAFIDTVDEREVKVKELRDYTDDERNKLFENAGWSASDLKTSTLLDWRDFRNENRS